MGIFDQLGLEPTQDDKKEALQMALLQGGLGILANNTNRRNPMPAIAAGAMTALPTYQGILKQKQADAMQRLKMMELKRQLEDEMALRNFDFSKYYRTPQQQALAGGGGPTVAAAEAAKNLKPTFDQQGMAVDMLNSRNPALMKQAMATLAKTEKPVIHSLSAGGVLTDDTGKVLYAAPFKPQEQQSSNLARLLKERELLPPDAPVNIVKAYDNAIRKESETSRQISGINVGQGLDITFSGVPAEDRDNLTKAVSEGRLDPYKLNSKTVKIYADILRKDPNVNLQSLGANAALQRNPAFNQKRISVETIPEIMQSMVDAGKKLDFAGPKVLTEMQAWTKGQLNSPEYTEYMVLRNDALMQIAFAMRGVGMTDKAHQAEIEVSQPSMTPAQLDAWMKAQMKSLEPRLKMYGKIMGTSGINKDSTSVVDQIPTESQTPDLRSAAAAELARRRGK